MGVTAAATPEISLRPFELSDADHLLEWMGDELVTYYTAWATLRSREEALDYLKNTVLPHPFYRAICIEGKPVGFLSFRPPSTAAKGCSGKAYCGIARAYWGRGIAAAAARTAVAQVFREFPRVERVEALAAVGNSGSQRMLENTGFVREGVHRNFYIRKGRLWDMVRYACFRVDPKL